jgi:Fe-S cluster biogenesis protein NfuA
MRQKIETALKTIRPFLAADGGSVELIDVAGDVVKLRLSEACGSCPMAAITLKSFVERQLKEQVPGVREVVAV